MKKKMILTTVTLLLILINTGCTTTKSLPLDIEALENREFKISSIILVTTQEEDPDQSGASFIIEHFPQKLEEIKKSLKEDHNILLDGSDFLSVVNDGMVDIKTEVLRFNTILNSYTWKNNNEYDQEISVGIPYSINKDYTQTIQIYFYKKNPDDPSTVFEETIVLNY